MMKIIIAAILLCGYFIVNAQPNEGTFWNPNPPNYDVERAFEVESIVPLFFYGGYHFALGYRYKKFRLRLSVIDGGTLDIEEFGVGHSSPEFKRFYKSGAGIFLGYNVWKNLELYGYLENHTFEIEKTATGEKNDMESIDTGIGVSYQFFIGRTFYIQPGFHTYYRADNSVTFSGNDVYSISNVDMTFVIRFGLRLYKKFDR